MNSLPDSLKYDIIDEKPPELPVKEVVTESGEVDEVPVDDSIPLEKPDDPAPEMPLFVPKPVPVSEDIFSEVKPKVKLTKKGKPRKPMSAEHKAKLAIAREKANAKRKFLAEQRKQEKARAKEEKELLKKKKELEFQKLKKEVQEPVDPVTEESNPNFVYEAPKAHVTQPIDIPKPTKQETILTIPHNRESVHKPQVQYVGLTREDLEKSHLEAILKVEAMRKERKAEKKKKAQIDAYNKETLETLKKHTYKDVAGIYGSCF